jgi:hypothetical protein
MVRPSSSRDVTPLEMEPMQIDSSTNSSSRRQPTFSFGYRLGQLLELIKLHIEYYPRVASCIAAMGVGVLVYFFVLLFRRPVTRNQLYRDYSAIDMDYNFQASRVDHWCLWGGDDQCACDDFTEPLSRSEKKDWLKTHKANVDRIDPTKTYNVVFYGDEVVEGWNGFALGKPLLPVEKGTQVRTYFTETFTKDGGGEFDGLALGVRGDVVSGVM